jgi:hypothetical protein
VHAALDGKKSGVIMNKLARILVVVIGALGVVTALAGLYYNARGFKSAIDGNFSHIIQQYHLTHFYLAFYSMSIICLAFYLTLVVTGVSLVRARTRHIPIFAIVLVLEVIYFLAVAVLWVVPSVGINVGAATGVANGGLMAQFYLLFPIWAPPVLWWAGGRLKRATSAV